MLQVSEIAPNNISPTPCTVTQLIKCIFFCRRYQQYIPGMQSYHDRVSRMVNKNNKEAADPNVFKQLQRTVVDIMSQGIYRAFFQSETFRDYCESLLHNDWGTVPVDRDELLRNSSLPTVHEDSELPDNGRSILDAPQPLKLTEQLLRQTQEERLKHVRPIGYVNVQ